MFRQNLSSSAIGLRKALSPWLAALCCASAISQSLSSMYPPQPVRLQVQQVGGEFQQQWGDHWIDSGPAVLQFRWSTGLQNAGAAKWEVLNENLAVVASGKAGQASAPYTHFPIDFRPIVGSNANRPLTYWVRVAVGSALRFEGDPPPPVLSARLRITIANPGPATQFTFSGLHPELGFLLPIAVDLQTLQVVNGGDGQEPYLLPILVYADGTTIRPRINAATKRFEFPDSSVRIAIPAQTHGNIVGSNSLNEGDIAPIPVDTGHFEAVLRPIGIGFIQQGGVSSADQKKLREASQVFILVIGMEEGSTPSTEVIDQVRAELVSGVQAELDNFLHGFTTPINDPQAPDTDAVAAQLAASLQQRIIASAKAKTMSELLSRLGIPGTPSLMFLLGLAKGLNHDEYVGYGVASVTYQDLLDAAEPGVDLMLDLTNADSDLHYQVRGRVRIRM